MNRSDMREVRFFREFIDGRRGDILDAAVSVFHERGYDAGTMRDIAEMVGISEPAIYRHFSGKEDLFEQLLAEAGMRLRSEIGPIIDSARPDNIGEVLSLLLANRKAAARTYLPVIQTAAIASMHNPRFLDVFREAIVGPTVARLGEVVRLLDEHYEIDPQHEALQQRVRLLVSTFVGYLITSALFDDDTPIDAAVTRAMGWDS